MGVVYAHVVHAHTSIEHLLVKKPWPRPSQAMKSPKPWPMAWPMISQSQSHEKPGQSPGFQAKPGRNITRLHTSISGQSLAHLIAQRQLFAATGSESSDSFARRAPLRSCLRLQLVRSIRSKLCTHLSFSVFSLLVFLRI